MQIKVSNLAFSKNDHLVKTLKDNFPNTVVNSEGIRLNGDALINFFSKADGVIVGLELINDEILEQLPNLKIISKFGVGLDNIDLEACKRHGVEVGWTGGVNKRSVAEMVIGFMLMLSRNLYITSNKLKFGEWNKNGGVNLTGKTVGIIGLGNIGKELVHLLKPFHCKILVNDLTDISLFARKHNLSIVPKDMLIQSADIISIHTPLTRQMQNFFNLEIFEKMKKTSILINTARGGIVNEVDLKKALKTKLIAGAALDVFALEPPIDLELLALSNLIATPHIGGNSLEAIVAMGESAIEHIVKYSKSSLFL